MLKNLSLKNRFLVAPVFAFLLMLILIYSSHSIINSQSRLFKQLNNTNLPQVSEISHITIALAKNHSELSHLLLSTINNPDEERTYVEGRKILNELHRLEQKLALSLANSPVVIVNNKNIIKQITPAFNLYKNAIIDAVELSTVDTKRAITELIIADRVVMDLNALFLSLSSYYVKELSSSSSLLEEILAEQSDIGLLSAVLLICMVFSAWYFSRRLSADIDMIYQAIISLTIGTKKLKLPEQPDEYIKKLVEAIHYFKRLLCDYEQQQQQLQKTISQLQDSEERFSGILNLVPTGIITINSHQDIIFFNRGAEQIFGYSSKEITGHPLSVLLPEHIKDLHKKNVQDFASSNSSQIQAVERKPIATKKKDGQTIYIDASLAILHLAHETLMAAAITDVSQRKEQDEKILHQAHFDSLTGLPNRFLSLDRLKQLLHKAKRNNKLVAVLFLDLDDFKKVNDSLGHDTGDQLLIKAAERLSHQLRSGDTVGRLGGDEFIVLLGGLNKQEEVQHIAHNLLKQFRKAFNVDDREFILTLSIGISIYPDDALSSSDLLQKADVAMYHSKSQGRNTYTYFTAQMNQDLTRKLALEEQIHNALQRNEFSLQYQPKINIVSGEIIGSEALLRWNNPELGKVTPDEFIPLLEQTGLIIPVGLFVLTEALAQTRLWLQDKPEFSIAINLSPRQFRDPDLVQIVQQTVLNSTVPFDHIELEITEGVLMSGHAYTEQAILDLHKLGIHLAMDDFGTGYSSLSYLRKYPFDVIKIDRSFIHDLITDKNDRALVTAIVSMAQGLDLKVVAEGVETIEQLNYMKEIYCDIAQGFYFSRPISDKDMTDLLKKKSLLS